jgi:hypothetical protein
MKQPKISLKLNAPKILIDNLTDAAQALHTSRTQLIVDVLLDAIFNDEGYLQQRLEAMTGKPCTY